MTNKSKYKLYGIQDKEGTVYDKHDMKVTRLFWFLIGFCANFLLLCITFYLTDLFAK